MESKREIELFRGNFIDDKFTAARMTIENITRQYYYQNYNYEESEKFIYSTEEIRNYLRTDEEKTIYNLFIQLQDHLTTAINSYIDWSNQDIYIKELNHFLKQYPDEFNELYSKNFGVLQLLLMQSVTSFQKLVSFYYGLLAISEVYSIDFFHLTGDVESSINEYKDTLKNFSNDVLEVNPELPYIEFKRKLFYKKDYNEMLKIVKNMDPMASVSIFRSWNLSIFPFYDDVKVRVTMSAIRPYQSWEKIIEE